MSEGLGRGLELGRAAGQHGKEVTCWRGKLCTSTCAAALVEDPAFYHSQPTTGQRAPARERRWWQSPEDGRQAEQMGRGQGDLRGHSSSHAGT